ncbi:translation initiation factor IF-2 N-terminal domain-containing protein [Myceligenerans pegani]|uniref:Translation initiation factor IF-2 N-terminal domain-containing protein n=1 Tax=Myceligenerans pegani TaxID=2776917 RepID=A0ABR9MZT6_9MICO|nr:translation initiation factor IF-2 N-terminal domain-containing protein [Myceligenerans sp. TRM 65318]MBE1876913.1 translation initiation factor IF-2 N-terminal domain-containing protein [Myceligenerans sp. TRM 65318]MBE3019184.1 translation initiation factor IF-2 N-terminal domain-containing protein [Myceligenerans sp. TRM 65318]
MRVRVYELARQLDVESKTVLRVLKELGEYVRSASSPLDDHTARAVSAKISGHPQDQVSPARPSRLVHEPTRPGNSLRAPVGAANVPRRTNTRIDPDERLTAEELGKRLLVRSATIRKWASRGYLPVVGNRGRSRLYRYEDARRVRDEAAARRRHVSAPPPIPELRWQRVRPVTASEAARLAGVSPSTIRTWVRRGHLTPLQADVRPMTFDASSVVRLADRQYHKRWSP